MNQFETVEAPWAGASTYGDFAVEAGRTSVRAMADPPPTRSPAADGHPAAVAGDRPIEPLPDRP